MTNIRCAGIHPSPTAACQCGRMVSTRAEGVIGRKKKIKCNASVKPWTGFKPRWQARRISSWVKLRRSGTGRKVGEAFLIGVPAALVTYGVRERQARASRVCRVILPKSTFHLKGTPTNQICWANLSSTLSLTT